MVSTDEEAVIVAQHRATHRFKEAWKIISPKPQYREDCEYDIVRALLTIPVAICLDNSKPAAENKKNLRRNAKKLRAAIPAVLWKKELIEGLKREAKFVENYADSIVVGKGKPRSSSARATAVHQAYELLKKYGSEPTYYRHGRWHNLAKVLLGRESAKKDKSIDLFDYIERYQPTVG
jgi:hypothetical protein